MIRRPLRKPIGVLYPVRSLEYEPRLCPALVVGRIIAIELTAGRLSEGFEILSACLLWKAHIGEVFARLRMAFFRDSGWVRMLRPTWDVFGYWLRNLFLCRLL